MSFSTVAQTTGAGINGGTSGSINTTGADLLIVNIGSGLGLAGTISDNKSNTWTLITSPSSNVVNNALYYAWNPIVGSGHTVTVVSVGGAASFEFTAFSGAQVVSDPLDQTTYKPTSGTFNPFPASIQTASGVTPTTNGQLIIMAYASNNTQSTPGGMSSSLSIYSSVLFASGNNYASGIGYFVQLTAANINPTYTPVADGDADYLSTTLASFKASAATSIKQLAALGVG